MRPPTVTSWLILMSFSFDLVNTAMARPDVIRRTAEDARDSAGAVGVAGSLARRRRDRRHHGSR
jgi:hypothetical protein